MTRYFAIALTALLLSATAPAQAAGIFSGIGSPDFLPDRFACMVDYQVRQAIAQRGYTHIYLNVMNNKHVEVRATLGDWVYLIDFNYCTGRIVDRTKLRLAQ